MYKNKKILIVNANYYKNITNKMLHLQLKELIKIKTRVKVISVSGAFEIPLMISRNLKKYDGFVAIGCVIKGETSHYDFICNSVFSSLIGLMIKSNKPIANSILTTNNSSQALKRVKKKSKESINSLKSFL
tara:strand:- start:360 stop:752 length:393 start_codon:yes stop_codon:yes gene_type:complete